MPLKPEHRYRNRIKKKLPTSIDVWSIHDSFTGGVPDVWYSGCDGDLWIEYKYFPRIPRKPIDLTSGKQPKLSRLQQHWLNRKLTHGRSVCVVVGFPDGGVILIDGEWMEPFDPNELMKTNDEIADVIKAFCGEE
jgi:hypothetical protein